MSFMTLMFHAHFFGLRVRHLAEPFDGAVFVSVFELREARAGIAEHGDVASEARRIRAPLDLADFREIIPAPIEGLSDRGPFLNQLLSTVRREDAHLQKPLRVDVERAQTGTATEESFTSAGFSEFFDDVFADRKSRVMGQEVRKEADRASEIDNDRVRVFHRHADF